VPPALVTAIIAVAVALVCVGGFLLVQRRLMRAVPPGNALVITPPSGGPSVRFTNTLVMPGSCATLVDITVKLLKVEREKTNPLRSRDDGRLRGVFTFYLRVSKTEDGVLHATQALGENPTEPAKLRATFLPKLDEALDTVAAMMTADDLLQQRQLFKDEVLKIIGVDLNGLCLDDMAIDELVRLER
jgi:uncharacterized membrane protein YqiK